jgi:DNA recombination-dependent growth factor C
MGARKGSVTARRYLVRGKSAEPARLLKGARAHALVPIDPDSEVERVAGWAAAHDPEVTDLGADTLFTTDGRSLVCTLRVDTLKPPAAVVKKLVAEKLRALGRKPSKRDKQEAKAMVVKSLRKRAFVQTRATDVVWQLDAGRVWFFSHGKKLNELVVDLFAKSFGLELQPAGPGAVAGRAALPGLEPTPELAFGFPGLPGRPADGEDGEGDELMEGDDA